LLDDIAERGGRANPPEGDAGDPDHRRRARRLDARAFDEAKALQRPLPDRDARGRQRGRGGSMTTTALVVDHVAADGISP